MKFNIKNNFSAHVSFHGTKHWCQNGLWHREGGPAVICFSGDMHWYQNGLLHREDGPATVCAELQRWYQNGKLHREDGPAVVGPAGDKGFYLGGKRLYEKTYWKKIKNEV